MTHKELQALLKQRGFYHGAIDGIFGRMSKDAAVACLTDGPDYELTDQDVASAAADLGVEPWKIWAVYEVEASGAAFIDGRPTILFEPHRFSKSTGHRYDAKYPNISSRTWNKKLYPGSQKGRWEQLMQAVALDVDAGFMSASYGGFQILGENYAVCGAPSPWSFAWRQSQTEGDQIDAFVAFVKGNGLVAALRQCQPGNAASCVAFVKRYNGTAYAQNSYDVRFAKALTKWKEKLS